MVDMMPRGQSFSRDKYEVLGLCKNIKSTNIKSLWKNENDLFSEIVRSPQIFIRLLAVFNLMYEITCLIYVYLRNQWLGMQT